MTLTPQTRAAASTERWSLSIDGTAVSLAITHRTGSLPPILFLHGFGSTKEDFTDVLLRQSFNKHSIIAYDAPGCGESTCSEPSNLSIPFLVKTAEAVLDTLGVKQFHLVGHSMGGLTALELAHSNPDRVLSFTNIKGNLAPEDCFLSRQIFDYPASDDEAFFQDFITRTAQSPYFGSSLYAATLKHKVRCESTRPIFTSMVRLSDESDLLGKFLALECPRVFMFGEQFESLRYLPTLAKQGVVLARIPHCGHFPMYSNPVAMWEHIGENIEAEEIGDVQDMDHRPCTSLRK